MAAGAGGAGMIRMRAMYLRLLPALSVVFAVAGPAAAGPSQLSVRSDQEILIQLERDWVAALQRNDVKFVDSVLAEEFVATYGDGSRGDRKRELQLVEEFNQQVDKWTVDEFTVKVFRDTAVVWFTQRLVGPVQGKPTEIVTRYMDVFVMRDGKWLCVASQSTRVTQK
jgi:ketosteroid isomerase-like protein